MTTGVPGCDDSSDEWDTNFSTNASIIREAITMSVKRTGDTRVDWTTDLDEYLWRFFEAVGYQQEWRSSR